MTGFKTKKLSCEIISVSENATASGFAYGEQSKSVLPFDASSWILLNSDMQIHSADQWQAVLTVLTFEETDVALNKAIITS